MSHNSKNTINAIKATTTTIEQKTSFIFLIIYSFPLKMFVKCIDDTKNTDCNSDNVC